MLQQPEVESRTIEPPSGTGMKNVPQPAYDSAGRPTTRWVRRHGWGGWLRRLRAGAVELTAVAPRRRYWGTRFARRARWLLALVAVGSLGIGLWWTIGPRRTRADRNPGHVIGEFALVDVRTGRLHRLSDHRGRVVVVVFMGTSCPVGELYLPRLSALSKHFEARVDFLAINSNESESMEDVAEHARRSRVCFPVLKDPENRVADQLLAERTCEALVIDRGCRLRYRGAVDDQYGLGTRRDSPARNYLTDAINAVLSGRTVAPETTHVVGCPIERAVPPRAQRRLARQGPSAPQGNPLQRGESRSRARLDIVPVTYASHVAPILHARCATCHRPSQVAPFSLLTYNDARRWASSIAEVVTECRMPPWHADPRYGHFANDRSLSADERSLLLTWVEHGTPPGDLAQAPRAPAFSEGWSIGTPDVVFEMPEAFVVQAEGTLPIQRFHITPHFTSDLWIQAAEARPGDRAVVHHICVYIDEHAMGSPRKPADENFLVAYTPGDMPSVYPPGVAKKLPRGADLIFEVHYTPIGRARFDRSAVGIITCKETPHHLAATHGIALWSLRIPPRDPDHVARASWKAPHDVRLLSMTPHMHLRGQSFRYTANYPDGRSETLLSVPHYDFNWQSVYRLAEPKPLPKGTIVACEAHYDNSAANPANPDPDRTVRWGEQTTDEMMIGFIDFEDVPVNVGAR
jgi:thiol-disulfide isomerase/thioredoxin